MLPVSGAEQLKAIGAIAGLRPISSQRNAVLPVGQAGAVLIIAVAISLIIGVPLASLLARSSLPGPSRDSGPRDAAARAAAGRGRHRAADRTWNDHSDRHRPAALRYRPSVQHRRRRDRRGVRRVPIPRHHGRVGLRQRDEHFEEVAATLGARPWRCFWRVTMPLAAPSVAAGAALCWARALGEFGATITFAGSYPGTTETLPIAAYSSFEGSGNVATAITLSLVLLTYRSSCWWSCATGGSVRAMTLRAKVDTHLGTLHLDCDVVAHAGSPSPCWDRTGPVRQRCCACRGPRSRRRGARRARGGRFRRSATVRM